MNQVTVQPTTILPAPMTPALRLEVDVLSNHLDREGLGHSIALEDAPSDEIRNALQRRSQRIGNCLTPVTKQGAAVEIMKLHAVLKSRGKGDAEADTIFDMYVDSVEGCPAFAVAEAVKDFIIGKGADRGWVPSPADLRPAVDAKAAPWRSERVKIEAILNAKVRAPRTSAEHRAQFAKEIRKTTAGISMAGILAERSRKESAVRDAEAKAEEACAKAEAETRRIDALIAAGKPDDRPLPQLSPELRAKYVTATTTHHEAAE